VCTTALGVVALNSYLSSVQAAVGHGMGGESQSPELKSMFMNLDRGEQGFADLDAIDAALSENGGEAGALTIAVGIFFGSGDAYSSGLGGARG
jgi:hypothetical protein